jgi:hypothetical protein
MSLLKELQQRGVFRAGLIYSAGVFGIVEIIEWLVGSLNLALPSWLMQSVAIIFMAGFPAAMYLAWVTDLERKLSYNIAAAVLIVIGGSLALFATVAPELEGTPRLLVMPPAVSGTSGPDEMALWASDDLRELLGELDEIEVIGQASTMMAMMNPTAAGIQFDKLGGTHTIRSELVHGRGRIQYDVLLIGPDGKQIWADSFKGAPLELFSFQKSVVEGIAANLGVPKNAAGLRIMRLREDPTNNLEAFRALARGEARFATDPMCMSAMEHFEEARELDPLMGRVYFGIGLCQGLQAWIPELPRDKPLWEAAIRNLGKAAELDASIAVKSWEMAANLEAARNRWEAAREFLNQARSISPSAFSFVLANSSGACREVRDWALQQYELDPMMPLYAGLLSNTYATCPGIVDLNKAVYWHEVSAGIFGEDGSADRLIPIYLQRGDRTTAMSLWQSNVKLFNPQLAAAEVDLAAMGNLRLNAMLDPAARQAFVDFIGSLETSGIASVDTFVFDLVAIGAVDKSYESIFRLIEQNRFNIHTFTAYGAGPDAVTRDPRFVKVMENIGMLVYWQQYGFPAYCTQTENGSFSCQPTVSSTL